MQALSEGNLVNAEFLLNQALRHADSLGAEAFSAKIKNNIGLVYREQGALTKAEECFRTALTVIERRVGKENKLYNAVLSNLHTVTSGAAA